MSRSHRQANRVAVLTPSGRGAVATVAVYGCEATQLVDRLFHPAAGKPLAERVCGRVCYGHWGDADATEEVVLCRRDDDHVEIHCHGGKAATARILADMRQAGCVETAWQEINRRRTDPLAADALAALANARTERTAAILLDQLDGALRRELDVCLSLIKQEQTAAARQRVAALTRRGRLGIHLTEPWRVVIAGAPNVGKSSLLNAIVGYDRSIVVDSPGTTRDVVSTATVIDGWPVLLSDTAGLRATEDEIEATGVALAEQQLAEADLVVLLFDRSQPWSDADQTLVDDWPDALVVDNKSDLPATHDDRRVPALGVSAIQKTGLARLQGQISDRLVPDALAPDVAVPFTHDQVQRLQIADAALSEGQRQVATEEIQKILT